MLVDVHAVGLDRVGRQMEVDATVGLPRRHDHPLAVTEIGVAIVLVDVERAGHPMIMARWSHTCAL